jgi:hypothetical protein
VAYSLIFKFAEAIFVVIGVWYLMQRGLSFFGRKVAASHAPGSASHDVESDRGG